MSTKVGTFVEGMTLPPFIGRFLWIQKGNGIRVMHLGTSPRTYVYEALCGETTRTPWQSLGWRPKLFSPLETELRFCAKCLGEGQQRYDAGEAGPKD